MYDSTELEKQSALLKIFLEKEILDTFSDNSIGSQEFGERKKNSF